MEYLFTIQCKYVGKIYLKLLNYDYRTFILCIFFNLVLKENFMKFNFQTNQVILHLLRALYSIVWSFLWRFETHVEFFCAFIYESLSLVKFKWSYFHLFDIYNEINLISHRILLDSYTPCQFSDRILYKVV